ncbi:osmoprotectant NAGGN system M42 family peptidase [Alphaproteobacteria bacterium HT1-32]|nr:osmoprotectant NAGGN system M42 family peptidase [Alphaproteobacteria bacterium HT1-32]
MTLTPVPDSPAPLAVSAERIANTVVELVSTPSPVGFTDNIVRLVCGKLDAMGAEYELTRRGAIRVNLKGRKSSPDRAVAGHVDTLGAQVKMLKENGRLELVAIGHWSSRFAEGARVTIFTDDGPRRGTILPLKASGHTYNKEIDTQPVDWRQLEIRVDEIVKNRRDLEELGFNIGDIVSIDAQPELTPAGFINSRHLDDKGGVAAMLEALRVIHEAGDSISLPIDCHFLFTISEEVGSGASAVLHGDVSELVSVDNGTPAPGQNSSEFGVTIGMADQTGPFDYHLTRHLIGLSKDHAIEHQREVFRFYRCDAASAVEAGNDIRTALITFGVDASHGYERTHIHSLESIARLLTIYVQSDAVADRDRHELHTLEGFPEQPAAE